MGTAEREAASTVASDVSALRKEGLNIALRHIDTFDSATQAVRSMPLYFVER